ncbi:MAG: DUF3794 domain-containing protein [Clostridia bacterium]|nr:DUF3794 domain-containing protein [Clostridia bacterium]
MVLETVNENLCVNKLIATKKDIIMVEGDMIVPDSKPDILNTICTSGVVCVYKKDVLTEKVRIDGNINTCIMYLADDTQDKVRGINTSLDFSEVIQVQNAKEGMNSLIQTKLKSIECKVINGRKVGIKATLEVDIKIYTKEEVEIVNHIQNAEGIQLLKEDLRVNSLVGMGENKIYTKDNITIDNIDNLAEILKTDLAIVDKDVKISYNKILAKAEAHVKIMYLTEDNRVNSVDTKIPIVGFIDIPNVTEENICDLDYEIKNMIMKPNASEEHSIYIELEIGVTAICYEEKQINLIQDLYSPCENLEFNKKKITTITNKQVRKEIKQIRENIEIEGMENKNIIDVDVCPVIEKQENSNSRIIYTGNLEINFVLSNQDLQMEVRNAKIPFEYTLDGIEEAENVNSKLEMEVANQDFIVQDGGMVTSNVDLVMNNDMYRSTNMNIMNEIQTNGEREAEDYSLILYVVKKGDTLWKIAKKYGSTIDDIVRTNGIEDENLINIGQKLFIPRYVKTGIHYE